MTNGAEQLDTRIEIVTPENIAFQYRVAGPFRRLPAFLIDSAIRFAIIGLCGVLFAFSFGMMGMEGMVWGLSLLLWFILSWFYGGLFETFWNGQTPGKRVMRIRVVSIDGQPINGIQATLRNFLLVVDALPPFITVPFPLFQVGLFAALSNDRFQRLGDMAAGTMVVIEEGHWLRGLIDLKDPDVVRLANQLPANFQMKRPLARAISAYVERRGSFSFGRRLEIARHVAEPLRERLNLPPNTNLDLLLCALYYLTFITERQEEPLLRDGPPEAEPKKSYPFAEAKR